MKPVAGNKKAHFDYFIEDKYEAGIELLGWEVKTARAGNVNLQDSFVFFTKGQTPQCFLKNAHFSPYQNGDVATQEVRRDRRLLLNRAQINKLSNAVKTKGYTCVVTRIYFNAKGRVKAEVALAKGKHNYDKKKTLRERDIAREVATQI
jgi:SsrA-binding protein